MFFLTSVIYKFLLRLPSWNYYTSWFSSFTIYYGCAVVVAVGVSFLVLTWVVQFLLYSFWKQCSEFFLFLHFKGVMAYGILNNFFLVVRIIESLFFLVNLHQKEILTQRADFSRYGTDCQNNRLCLSLWVFSRLLLTRLSSEKFKESV